MYHLDNFLGEARGLPGMGLGRRGEGGVAFPGPGGDREAVGRV